MKLIDDFKIVGIERFESIKATVELKKLPQFIISHILKSI